MSDTSANLGLPYVAAAQAQKHVTVNEAVRRLDAFVQIVLESATLAAPPALPASGARWFVPAGASGVFAGKAGQIAAYEAGAFDFLPCGTGFLAFIRDERRLALYDGARWVSPLAASPHGAAVSAAVLEEDVVLSGASTDTVMRIPDRAIVLAVTTRTLEAVTGVGAYDCGVPSETSKYGGSLGAAAGSTNSGVTGPTAFYAPTPVRLTPTGGGSFTGGRVRVAIHFFACPVPDA